MFAEDIDLESLLEIKKINTEVSNIAGIDIPIFINIDFIFNKLNAQMSSAK